MSAGCLNHSPKLLKKIRDFEEALSRDLEALKPKEEDKVLCFSWLASGVSLALEKHKEAVRLIPALEFPLLVCDEQWMNDYMDQTTRMLDVCNAVTAMIFNIEQGHLLIRHACHTLLHVQKVSSHQEACPRAVNKISLYEEQLSRAQKSLRQWLDLHVSESLRANKCSSKLQDMIKGLKPPKEKAIAKGKGFLYALYGANAAAVFIFYVLILAFSLEDELLSFSVWIPGSIGWSASISHLVQMAKEEARQHLSVGSNLWLADLCALESRVKDLSSMLGFSLDTKTWPLPEEEAKNMAGAVTVLSWLLDDLEKRLELLGMKLNEMFKAIVASRSALLDKLGDFGTQGA